jgi:Flp pilus assembly protein TadD
MCGPKMQPPKRALGWPVLVASVILLSGCSDKSASIPTSASDNRAALSTGDSGAALRMARTTRSAGDLNTAVLIYRNIVATGVATDGIKIELGDTLVEAGSPDDAIDIYSQVGAKSSARLDSLLGLTRAYVDLGDPTKALEYADEAKLAAPQDPRVLVDRGVALDSLKRHGEAQECYRSVLSIAPRHVSARNNLALSLALTGQFDEAVAMITPLVRSSSATPQVRENMAVIYGLMGDADHAAAVSRMDLDDGTTKKNLAFLAAVRETKP